MKRVKSGATNRQIRKRLSAAHKRWASSITDKELRKRVEIGTFMTGGCIASMLLGEDVNDFDIYCKDFETAEDIAIYYAAQYNTHYLTRGEPKSITYGESQIMNIDGDKERRLVIRGADTYPIRRFPKRLDAEGLDLKYQPVCFTSNAITLSDNIQLITRFQGEPSEIHRNFDFVHCFNSYDPETNSLDLKEEALQSLLARRLIYRGSLYPFASIHRMLKFVKRGWRISAGQLMKISLQINKVVLTQETMRDQWLGVDSLYMRRFIQELESRKGSLGDISAIYDLLDEIFD